MVLGLRTMSPNVNTTYYFASPDTLFGLDTDLSSIFHRPGNYNLIVLLLLFFFCMPSNTSCSYVSELKARNFRPLGVSPDLTAILPTEAEHY